MNKLKQISLLQFRNYSVADFSFLKNITCITGANGSGKTNLLDAIYYLCYTKSYFSSYRHLSVKTGTDGFRISGVFYKNNIQETITCKWKAGKKEVFLNEKEYEKITDHIGKYSAVMIAPDDTEIITGGSEFRRKWIDGILSQTNRTYLEKLLHYQRVLLQRNAWLKLQNGNPNAPINELDYYNIELSASGEYLHQERNSFLISFLPILTWYYNNLSGNKESISIFYNSSISLNSLINLLSENIEHDLRYQRTIKGIHKDDLEFNLNSLPLKHYGSQGQKKTFLFALKLAQFEYLNKTNGFPPILLLDDIFEKLDQQRIESLLRIICKENFGQVILTDTHADRVKSAFGNGVEVDFITL